MTSKGAAGNDMSIEDQRAKCNMVYRESIAPGLTLEMDLKGILASKESQFQKVEILSTYFGKTLITDGKTQSAEFDEFAYHESLVHPAMLKAITGGPVKRVFIGGGGELATAREVLRYSCVEKVVMVDLDEVVVDFCREHLPEWGGETVTSNARFDLVIGDAFKYLNETKDKFDVIIMDISDPIEAGPGIMLYTKEFYDHAKTLLSPHGVFVTQAGTAESVPAAVVTVAGTEDPSCFAPIANTLGAVFSATIPYSTNIPSFGGDWGFVMAFENSSIEAVASWKSPEAGKIDTLVTEHIIGGSEALKFYDGVSHMRMFHLVKPLRSYMNKDNRVMTRDNPVFMY